MYEEEIYREEKYREKINGKCIYRKEKHIRKEIQIEDINDKKI